MCVCVHACVCVCVLMSQSLNVLVGELNVKKHAKLLGRINGFAVGGMVKLSCTVYTLYVYCICTVIAPPLYRCITREDI